MNADKELHDLGDATSLVVERIVQPVEGMHRTISDRAFRYAGPPGTPIRGAHDTIAGGVYSAIRRGARVVGWGAGAMLARRLTGANPVSDSQMGAGLQAALNGVWGDELASRGNALAVALSVRVDGQAIAVDPAGLAAAYPAASSHIVVLLHGLGQTEQCWLSPLTDGTAGLYDLAAATKDLTPVAVRFNTGLSVAESGAKLAQLLESLSLAWPIPNARVSLVGYSMGGLVARSAYAAGVSARHEWVGHTLDVITVGAPHHGSAIARGVALSSRALRIARTSRPLSDFLETASIGIKDMRDGAGVAEAWEEAAAAPSGQLANIRQHFVAAVVTGDPGHPFGVLVGDFIVRVGSATGQALGANNVRVLASRRHFDLLADPDIVHQIIEWLLTDSL